LALLKLGNASEISSILRNHGLGVSKAVLTKVYLHATAETMVPLFLDLTAHPEAKFKKGFEVIDVNAI
jgi:hypothetical protein